MPQRRLRQFVGYETDRVAMIVLCRTGGEFRNPSQKTCGIVLILEPRRVVFDGTNGFSDEKQHALLRMSPGKLGSRH